MCASLVPTAALAVEGETEGEPAANTVSVIETADNNADKITMNLFDFDISSANQNEGDRWGNTAPNWTGGGFNNHTNLKFYGSGGTSMEIGNANAYTGGNIARQGIVAPVLGENGYPIMMDFVNGSSQMGQNLETIFSPTNVPADNTKHVYKNVSHLFKINERGNYYYNSDENYAYFDVEQENAEDGGSFVVYDRTHPGYVPSRDLQETETVESVGFNPFDAYDEGKMRMEPSDSLAAEGIEGYNHQHGLTLETNIVIPENGMINGKDIFFSFSGDDDAWLFVDGVLVLDVGGIHMPTSGSVNFTTGEVNVSDSVKMSPYSGNNNVVANGSETTIKDIFQALGREWNPAGEHNVKFFYLERGGCFSNLSMETNLWKLTDSEKKTIPVKKIWNVEPQDGTTVRVQLFADGEPTGEYISLTKDNNWEGEFANVPIYRTLEEGSTEEPQQIEYTVKEDHVDGYYTIYNDPGLKQTVYDTYWIPATAEEVLSSEDGQFVITGNDWRENSTGTYMLTNLGDNSNVGKKHVEFGNLELPVEKPETDEDTQAGDATNNNDTDQTQNQNDATTNQQDGSNTGNQDAGQNGEVNEPEAETYQVQTIENVSPSNIWTVSQVKESDDGPIQYKFMNKDSVLALVGTETTETNWWGGTNTVHRYQFRSVNNESEPESNAVKYSKLFNVEPRSEEMPNIMLLHAGQDWANHLNGDEAQYLFMDWTNTQEFGSTYNRDWAGDLSFWKAIQLPREIEIPDGLSIENHQAGTITITKDVPNKEATEKFTFKITFTDDVGKTLTGTFGDVDIKEGSAEFTLGDGEKIEIKDLPAGVEYKIEETPVNGYAMQENANMTGVVAAGEVADVVVVNEVKSSGGHSGGGGGGTTAMVTLSFQSNGGTPFDSVKYNKNAKATLDKLPTKDGYKFTGWYLDEELTQLATETVMDKDKTVYAGWEKVDEPVLDLENHYAYIIGFPEDYRTGERTDDTSLFPVKPLAPITRAEVTTVFFRMLTDDMRDKNWTTANTYSDVQPNEWFNNAISVMTKLGIVQGIGSNQFAPNAPITRGEMAAIAARFARMMDSEEVNENVSFNDIAGHWAEADILHAASVGWVKGDPDGKYRPNDNITRAEFMTLANRMLEREPEEEADLLDGMITWPDNQDKSAWYYYAVQEATNSHKFSRKDEKVDGLNFYYEKWVSLEAVRDWSALERSWSHSNSADYGGGEVYNPNH